MSKFEWTKYLTREYSFLYISYATDCYRLMPKLVGATIKFDLAHGQNDLVTLYGIGSDFERCYNEINKGLLEDKNKGIRLAEEYNKLSQQYYFLVKQIENVHDLGKLKEFLLKLDTTFLDLLCYYLYFVYLGYGGERPAIKLFLDKNKETFEKIRNSGIDTHMDKGFPRLFGKFNTKFTKLIQYLSRQELLNLLNDKNIDLQNVENRRTEYLLVTKNSLTTEYPPSQIKDVLTKEIGHTNNTAANELAGRVAYNGLIRGIVKIILTEKDYSKIQNGDIVVTPMTKPAIAPFLKKAKGIITNDGGALCHASIISREMKIPCLVGTIHATEVFKDGDLVELDTTKKIARKISH